MRKRAAVAAFAALLTCAGGARAGMNLIPLPEILTDPNEGNTYGLLPVLLLLDREGKLEHIVAHDIRWNRITGWFGGFRLFGYPTLDQRYYLTLRKSEKIDEDYIGEYESTGLFGGAASVLANFTYWRDSRLRFFGFGNDTGEESETNYTQRRLAAFVRVGYRPRRNWEIAWQGRGEDVSIGAGGVDDLPFAADTFPGTRGLEGSRIHGQGLSLAFDDRDSPRITSRGTLGLARVEVVDRALGATASFVKYGFEVRRFVPFRERFVLAMRAALDYLSGAHQTPFYERPSLGGVNTLRGFGDGRFVDAHRFVGTAELRAQALALPIMDVMTEFEVAPFLDAGQVFSEQTTFPLESLHFVGGVGFRGVVRPQVVGYVDIGIGSDGAAV
ncbi:MAG: BamA/TamA family outer membrane protein, partial [Candidatus Binatia bacterium]